MLGILTFIIIIGILVGFHEYGHLVFAKKAGILVREFAIGMGPKLFAHTGKDGTVYTIRLLPLGGYVRMAGWGDDKTEIRPGTPASLALADDGKVTCINLSQKQYGKTTLPITITAYDLEDQLTVTGLVFDETKTYAVDHEATIIEADGTELRIAPLDVQYQNASIWGRMMTNFAGPLNNFILGVLVFIALVFVQGGVEDLGSNRVQVTPGGALALAGVKSNDQILAIDGTKVHDWTSLIAAMDKETAQLKAGDSLVLTIQSEGEQKNLSVVPKEEDGRFYIGVTPSLKTGFIDQVLGGFQMAWRAAFTILASLKSLIQGFSLNKLGGPVAIYQMSHDAAQGGIVTILSLMGLLSINLGIFNLIPIPALDGGKIVINIVEAIRRKPLKQETETYITLAGVAVMVLLMLAVTWNDIMRAFF